MENSARMRCRRSRKRPQLRQDAAVQQVVDYFLGVDPLFNDLFLEEAGEAIKVLVLAPDGERLVGVRSPEFVVQLPLKFVEDG